VAATIVAAAAARRRKQRARNSGALGLRVRPAGGYYLCALDLLNFKVTIFRYRLLIPIKRGSVDETGRSQITLIASSSFVKGWRLLPSSRYRL
jgi:hypothetical protein